MTVFGAPVKLGKMMLQGMPSPRPPLILSRAQPRSANLEFWSFWSANPEFWSANLGFWSSSANLEFQISGVPTWSSGVLEFKSGVLEF